MPGTDNPTRRVAIVIALLIALGVSLRGYLPGPGHAEPSEPGADRAALLFIVAALGATTLLLAVAIVARLRDPRAVASGAGDLSGLLGTDRGRPSWRVLLIGAGLIVAWLSISMLLAQLFAPHDNPAAGAPESAAQPAQNPPASGNTPPGKRPPERNDRDTFAILAAGAVPLLLVLVTGMVVAARRRPRVTPGLPSDDAPTPPVPPSASLASAAEAGLAEMVDPHRAPREAIIACYAAMERQLAGVPGAAPQDCDTPTEVLARAVERRVLRPDNAAQAAQLVDLFAEARFSPHLMNEGHRQAAARALQRVLEGLAA